MNRTTEVVVAISSWRELAEMDASESEFGVEAMIARRICGRWWDGSDVPQCISRAIQEACGACQARGCIRICVKAYLYISPNRVQCVLGNLCKYSTTGIVIALFMLTLLLLQPKSNANSLVSAIRGKYEYAGDVCGSMLG